MMAPSAGTAAIWPLSTSLATMRAIAASVVQPSGMVSL